MNFSILLYYISFIIMYINWYSLKIYVYEYYEYMVVIVVMYVVNEFILKIYVY